MDSILNTIKKMLGIDSSDTSFDVDIKVHINSVFNVLHQLGVGPDTCFRITGDTETWDDFISNRTDIESVKDYIYLRVKLVFDPPSSSTVLESYKNTISELEYRLFVTYDNEED